VADLAPHSVHGWQSAGPVRWSREPVVLTGVVEGTRLRGARPLASS
jgi:hypothetical protein